jgi:hypothetical protein
MKKLEKELNNIFEEYKGKYISEFDQSEGLNAKLNNQVKFTPLYYELTAKLTELANTKRGYTSSADAEIMVKNLLLKFSHLF